MNTGTTDAIADAVRYARKRRKDGAKEIQNWIDGRPVKSRKMMERTSPADGTVVTRFPSSGQAEVDAAVQSARRAFEADGWSNPSAAVFRKDCLLKLARLIRRHTGEIAGHEALENGMPIAMCAGMNVPALSEALQWYAETIDKWSDESLWLNDGCFSTISREPVGVVGLILPWNFPAMILGWKIAPALAAGCTVVVKPSGMSPHSAFRFAELAKEAGFPDGVVNTVVGPGPVGAAMAEHMDIDCLAFTGSGRTGRAISMAAARSNLKRVWLELGGKTCNIVFDDGHDFAAVIRAVSTAFFKNQGQICNAPSRLIVPEARMDEAMEIASETAGGLAIGDNIDPENQFGPVITVEAAEAIQKAVENACAEGARRATGGAIQKGCFFAPTVLGHVQETMVIAQEEVFGPVFSIIGHKGEEDAIRIANNTRYGLGAGLWSTDLSRAHRAARQLRAGAVTVNTPLIGSLRLPFGGYRESGHGRDRSLHAIEKYTELKATSFVINTE